MCSCIYWVAAIDLLSIGARRANYTIFMSWWGPAAYADIYSYWTMVRLRTASLLGLASEPQLKQRSSELARPSQLPPSASPELRPMVLLPRELHAERTI